MQRGTILFTNITTPALTFRPLCYIYTRKIKRAGQRLFTNFCTLSVLLNGDPNPETSLAYTNLLTADLETSAQVFRNKVKGSRELCKSSCSMTVKLWDRKLPLPWPISQIRCSLNGLISLYRDYQKTVEYCSRLQNLIHYLYVLYTYIYTYLQLIVFSKFTLKLHIELFFFSCIFSLNTQQNIFGIT